MNEMIQLDINGVLFLITNAFLIGGLYAGIRADIKHLIKKTEDATESAKHAHRRIDEFMLER